MISILYKIHLQNCSLNSIMITSGIIQYFHSKIYIYKTISDTLYLSCPEVTRLSHLFTHTQNENLDTLRNSKLSWFVSERPEKDISNLVVQCQVIF